MVNFRRGNTHTLSDMQCMLRRMQRKLPGGRCLALSSLLVLDLLQDDVCQSALLKWSLHQRILTSLHTVELCTIHTTEHVYADVQCPLQECNTGAIQHTHRRSFAAYGY